VPVQNDFKASRYVFIVSSIGFVGLVVSLFLLYDFIDPVMNILKLMLGGMFGW
jgi:hypothetical protein